jgi:hypothetical protein
MVRSSCYTLYNNLHDEWLPGKGKSDNELLFSTGRGEFEPNEQVRLKIFQGIKQE